MSNTGYNESGLINIPDNDVGLAMLDKLARIKAPRRTQPVPQIDNIDYDHRYMYDNFNLQIGDTYFMIPPEFIMVSSVATSQSIVTLRQENSQKMKSGYHKRNIMIDLVFNGLEQINGYKVDGPEGTYYMDGLRQLLAQFKCTPFLPIRNELINGMYGIFSVVLQSITMHTQPGFPDMMSAQITLQEVEMFPYIEMPNVAYQYMIDWDLFRFYYQRLLTETHEYKKLQSLPANKNYNRFKLSVINSEVFAGDNLDRESILDLICDSENYTTWVNSDESDVVISNFQCGYSNLLTNIQLSDCSSPTVQYIGGMDTLYNITFETTDYSVVQAIEQCQISNDVMTRDNIQYHAVGFVKLESELVELTGSLFVMIENVTTNTVPGFAGLYNVQINCVAYDIAQSEREDLSGFIPFPDTQNAEGQSIEQSVSGLKTKIKQDNYAEWKLRTTIEVYPDLHLPTFAETDAFIAKCIAFRNANNLTPYPLSSYPRAPINMLHGLNPWASGNVCPTTNSDGVVSGWATDNLEYNVYVDPDFYVFYPASYGSYEEEAKEAGEKYYTYEPKQRSSYTKTKIYRYWPYVDEEEANSDGTSACGSNLATQFVNLAKTFIGCTYILGAEGEISDSAGLCFDCSGFVTYLMKAIGLMPADQPRFVVPDLFTSDLFTEVSWNERQLGDSITIGRGHVVIYEGNDQVIHASNEAPYPQGGVKESPVWFDSSEARVFRPKGFNSTSCGTSSTTASSAATSNIAGTLDASETNVIKQQIWAFLKADGYSDAAAAAIIGNFMREAGSDLSPSSIEAGNGIGVGLAQWSFDRRTNLQQFAADRGVTESDLGVQLEFFKAEMDNQYGDDFSGGLEGFKASTDVAAATAEFEEVFEKAGVVAMDERIAYAQETYNLLSGTVATGSSKKNPYTLTYDEYISICKAIMAETKGEDPIAEKAMAQLIYDQLTHPKKKFGGLGEILADSDFSKKYPAALNSTVGTYVKQVFCNNARHWEDYKIYSFSTTLIGWIFEDFTTTYDKVGDISYHTYWGTAGAGSTIKYTIEGVGTSTLSYSAVEEVTEVTHEAVTISSADGFAEPVIIATEDYMYDDKLWDDVFKSDFWTNLEAKSNSKKVLNSEINIFNTAFCDEYQYSGRGKMVRAFPTYLFCILDDNATWFDGKKLWTNYYVHRSMVDISCHEANDMSTATAQIVVTNSYHNLDRTSGGLSDYSISKDSNGNLVLPSSDGYSDLQLAWYNLTGTVPGLGPKLTSKMIELHSIIYEHAKLQDGARVHLRMGYGSDPLSLAPVINGFVSDIQLGDQIGMVVTSDGVELVQHITSANENDSNNGIFGLFGLGEDQESSNIIATLMTARQSWFNHLMKGSFEGSKYSIEHFGLYFHQGLANLSIADIANGVQEQYDILKNIYKANYKKEHYIFSSLLGLDGEQNIVFNKYNMTPWDVFQVCTQQVPEYIVKPSYHQFDSRLYFGLPFFMEKYRYNYMCGKVYEECKTASQVHILESVTNIIDNQLKVTSKYSNTNIKCMYQLGSTVKSTATIHSDDTIDFSRQKTTIMDTPIVQDALGPDALWDFLGYSVGKNSARRVGISNLLYGWEQQYQGQILIMGCPGMKAHDRILINDNFAKINGIASVREVVHSFNSNTGYTTSVTPGMISFSTDENSGAIETTLNFLMILNCFSSYLNVKREVRINYEHSLHLFSDLEAFNSKLIEACRRSFVSTGTTISNMANIAGVAYNGAIVYNIARNIRSFESAATLGRTFMKAGFATTDIAKALKSAKNISGIYKGIKAGVIAVTGVPTGGIGSIISAIVFIAIDILLGALFEWLSNKNVCTLLPLWWNGYPFAAGVKDGEKILLIDSTATATDENTREDATTITGEDIESN